MVWIGVFASAALLLLSIPLVGGMQGLSSPGFQVVCIVCLLLIVIAIGIKRFHLKFSYRIVIDHDARQIAFHLYRDNSVVTYSFDDLKKIYVNGYIYFTTPDMKIMYNDLSNKNLFISLRKIDAITWGPACKLWGPPKEFREQID